MERMLIPKTPETAPLRKVAADAKRQVHLELQKIREAKWEALKDATIDPLTSKDGSDILNNRGYEKAIIDLQNKFGGPRRRRTDPGSNITPFSMIGLDIDHFKAINDTYGHDAGDVVLRTFAQRVRRAVRSDDIVARCGGEEFRVIVLAANGNAPLVAEKIKKIIANDPVLYEKNGERILIPITVSAGISPYDVDKKTMETEADRLLYKAKENGRNQVWFSDKDGDREYNPKKEEPATELLEVG